MLSGNNCFPSVKERTLSTICWKYIGKQLPPSSHQTSYGFLGVSQSTNVNVSKRQGLEWFANQSRPCASLHHSVSVKWVQLKNITKNKEKKWHDLGLFFEREHNYYGWFQLPFESNSPSLAERKHNVNNSFRVSWERTAAIKSPNVNRFPGVGQGTIVNVSANRAWGTSQLPLKHTVPFTKVSQLISWS